MPSTNVAESADVIKNDETRITAKIESGTLIGISLNMANSCISGPSSTISGTLLATSIPVTPKTVNQMMPIVVGTSRSAITNSRTVLPFETRAIKIPTNELQLNHHAQYRLSMSAANRFSDRSSVLHPVLLQQMCRYIHLRQWEAYSVSSS